MIRMLDEILLPGFEVEFIVENRPLARRLSEAGVHVIVGDPRRLDTFVKADLGPSTCVIIEDNGRRSPKRIVEAVRDAGGTLIYILGIGTEASAKRAQEIHEEYPDASYLAMAGVRLEVIAEILGHRNVQTTRRYAHLAPSYLGEQMEKMADKFIHVPPPKGSRNAEL